MSSRQRDEMSKVWIRTYTQKWNYTKTQRRDYRWYKRRAAKEEAK
jgi:hypothetical protein